EEAERIAREIGLPLVVRPSFTLGGSGGGTARTLDEFRSVVRHGLAESPAHEVLIEESVEGWKEFELEVMRDHADNVIVVCSIENFDAMGVHTGDSITVAPQMTLSDRQYQEMRNEAKAVIRKVGVDTGGSNIQFAVEPRTGRRVVIEMNPRVSRSSALASKATGFPIAKIAALLAVGFTLDEIPNDITKKTPACFEPSLDYVVVKVPRWAFEKFPKADPTLTIQMKSVGEAMAIGRTFSEALGKAIRSLEIGRDGLDDGRGPLTREDLLAKLEVPTWERIFHLRRAFLSGMSVEEVADRTRIDPWFLDAIRKMVREETCLAGKSADVLSREELRRLKRVGLSDAAIGRAIGCGETVVRALRKKLGVAPVFKTIDTCAAEFEAYTPYYYSTYEDENESLRTDKAKVVILGGGPNRIGQGIEFDYCCVHACYALAEAGYETIMINCNPETVSTDYDTSDRLYFEPLTFEDVTEILDNEKPDGVLVQFGGQTPLKLARPLEAAGYPIWGTSPESIDLAEDRARFGKLLDELGLEAPPHGEARTRDEALSVARSIGYPLVVRPSYVLGGRAMAIVFDDAHLVSYMDQALEAGPDHPVLIDRFLDDAFEFDVDALSDGNTTWIGGIQEHIEKAGIHSGDSFSVLPAWKVMPERLREMADATRRLGKALAVKGLMNIQFAVQQGILYVLEVNPRASRTVPFVSKAIGVPMARA
ncbi:MAG TPA: carbamoyl-phosphate synthase large subunit, partial [Thermoanaerobaculia bacterium]|nr:carbamoyl-phosphate synthase large subunit [Thermoanaerobaculia bacterium]